MEFVLVLFGYLLGSIPTGYILGFLAGVDVRKAGSGNVGATNVARVVGKRQGLLTLVADAAKGFIPVFVSAQFGLSATVIGFVGVAAFLGHLFPVFLKFQGGKGVATALGVFLGLAPLASLILILIFTAVVLCSRLVSLSSMTAAVIELSETKRLHKTTAVNIRIKIKLARGASPKKTPSAVATPFPP